MLWAETASPTMVRNGTDVTAVTVGRFGENVYSQIRRFVVMQVNRQKHFVYACPIFTYGGQGVLKNNCLASEHTIVYLNNTQPKILRGEWEKGMRKEPIEITPSDPTEQMASASRLRFGKHHSIEWNVKVREIGIVSSRHMSKLMSYYKEESSNGFDDDDHYSAQDEGNGVSETTTQPSFQQAESIQPTSTGESYTRTSYPNIAPTQMYYTPPAWSQPGSNSAYTTNYPAQHERR
ncbi:hypothetical protein FB567DRAFT_436283 [Paraphoma chrysanthemicola]|uniref:DUF6590 domain-containing protein n=1 Tax=Paraphoma chrysanthemicola TaxID=798071 RepID=A0A8K0REP9_9PLEO|nr:hypothetical protein FB567DRAFT_436283 [Paraphoma chrysanthemicola]